MNASASGGSDSTTSGTYSADDLGSLSLVELLKADQRPSFVVDLKHVSLTPTICYRNPRFIEDYDFEVARDADTLTEVEQLYFRNWALSDHPGETTDRINYLGLSWSGTTLRGRWKVIQATTSSRLDDVRASDTDSDHTADLQATGLLEKLPKGSSDAHAQWVGQQMVKGGFHDWTAARPPKQMSEHVRFLREWEWSKTPLGPIEKWSPQLKLMANLIASDPNPAVLFWGKELASIYNESYVPLLHDKHPKALGEPYHKTWHELYRQEEVAKDLDELWTKNIDGEAILWQYRPFFLRDGNRLQEKVFHMSFIPILGEDGKTAGIYESIKEITMDLLNERRSATIRRVNELTMMVENIDVFFEKVMEGLKTNVNDVPFAMIYFIDPAYLDEKSAFNLARAEELGCLRLRAHLGTRMEDGKPAVHNLLLRDPVFVQRFYEVCKSHQLSTFDLESRPSLVEAIMEENPTRGFGDNVRFSVLLPIEPIVKSGVAAVLFMGTNPRRPYNVDYETFVRSLGRSISSSLAALILTDTQKKAVGVAEKAMGVAQGMQKRALAMVETSPVGAAMAHVDGTIIYANKSWKDITGYQRDDFYAFSWMDILTEETGKAMAEAWPRLVRDKTTETFELALRKPWRHTDPVSGETVETNTYILTSAQIITIDGDEYMISSNTDISHQKWMQSLHQRRVEEALELKRQQENFMDMTSHEMRNPLSAIFQCADAIVASLSALRRDGEIIEDLSTSVSVNLSKSRDSSPEDAAADLSADLDEALQQAIENAGIISLAAQHQKRIVDDVLVLSKFDANMIEVHPIDVEPRAFIDDAIKMFAAELTANQAKMIFTLEDSFSDLRIEKVKLDPGRVLQILINLLTNAIKFSMNSASRDINITLGASAGRPAQSSRGIVYQVGPEDEVFSDQTSKPEWGEGEELYLQFEISDKGQGMTKEETKLLFQRFTQASARTHTQYGGTGLGLFIARLLSRMQGGEIGVTSIEGQGTTFAFFIKVRRADASVAKGKKNPLVALSTAVAAMKFEDEAAAMLDEEDEPPVLIPPEDISILIVEDNIVNQRVLKKQLQMQGFRVTVANNGAESLEILQKSARWIGETPPELPPSSRSRRGSPIVSTKPSPAGSGIESIMAATADPPSVQSTAPPLSLILMDIEMPVMNGTDAASRIRELEARGDSEGHVPIIAITANARAEQIRAAKQSGMDDVVSKPFRIPELLEKIGGYVGPLKLKGKK